jgi:hypothetical protein
LKTNKERLMRNIYTHKQCQGTQRNFSQKASTSDFQVGASPISHPRACKRTWSSANSQPCPKFVGLDGSGYALPCFFSLIFSLFSTSSI